jgi:raffinose/stachyose/melibiose transport system permease protein
VSQLQRELSHSAGQAARVPVAPSAGPRRAEAWGAAGRVFRKGTTWLLALVWLVVVGAPIYYMIVASIEPTSVYLSANPWFPTKGVTGANYGAVFSSGIVSYFFNSVIVAGSTTILAVTVSLLAAYAIVVHAGRWTGIVFRCFLVGFAVPIQALMIPLYLAILRIGLYDSLLGLILPMAAFSLPITILVLVNFLRDVPRSLIDAMRVDGAGPLRVLIRLVLPLSWPAIATVGVFDLVISWNNFVFPLILTQSPSEATLPLAVFNFEGNHLQNVPEIMAAVALSAVPLFVLYLVARRRLMAGLAAGFGA